MKSSGGTQACVHVVHTLVTGGGKVSSWGESYYIKKTYINHFPSMIMKVAQNQLCHCLSHEIGVHEGACGHTQALTV